jgi:hypothetical protein
VCQLAQRPLAGILAFEMTPVPERLIHYDVSQLSAISLDALGPEPGRAERSEAFDVDAAGLTACTVFTAQQSHLDCQSDVPSFQIGKHGLQFRVRLPLYQATIRHKHFGVLRSVLPWGVNLEQIKVIGLGLLEHLLPCERRHSRKPDLRSTACGGGVGRENQWKAHYDQPALQRHEALLLWQWKRAPLVLPC